MHDLFELFYAEEIFLGQKLHMFGHAIGTAQIAAIGDR